MTMKKTDLEKNKAQKLAGQMRQAGAPQRFAQGAAPAPDRRAQRDIDRAAGLVPFAAKLHSDLIRQMQERAVAQGVSLNDLTDQLLRAGLARAAGQHA